MKQNVVSEAFILRDIARYGKSLAVLKSDESPFISTHDNGRLSTFLHKSPYQTALAYGFAAGVKKRLEKGKGNLYFKIVNLRHLFIANSATTVDNFIQSTKVNQDLPILDVEDPLSRL